MLVGRGGIAHVIAVSLVVDVGACLWSASVVPLRSYRVAIQSGTGTGTRQGVAIHCPVSGRNYACISSRLIIDKYHVLR